MDMRTSLQALAIARSTEADDAVLAVYLHSLSDLDVAIVSTACERLAREPRKDYQAALPEVGLIRAEASKVAREIRQREELKRLAPAPDDADPRTWVHCTTCADTSWSHFRCHGGSGDYGIRDGYVQRFNCGRRTLHAAHTYVERCGCYDTNPRIAAQRRPRVTRDGVR
jgi:hypothetical protein